MSLLQHPVSRAQTGKGRNNTCNKSIVLYCLWANKVGGERKKHDRKMSSSVFCFSLPCPVIGWQRNNKAQFRYMQIGMRFETHLICMTCEPNRLSMELGSHMSRPAAVRFEKKKKGSCAFFQCSSGANSSVIHFKNPHLNRTLTSEQYCTVLLLKLKQINRAKPNCKCNCSVQSLTGD